MRKLRQVLDRMIFKLERYLPRYIEQSIGEIILEPLADFDKLFCLDVPISIHLRNFVCPELFVHI